MVDGESTAPTLVLGPIEPPVGGVSRYARALTELLASETGAGALDLDRTTSEELGIEGSIVRRLVKRIEGSRSYALRSALSRSAPGLVIDNHAFAWSEPGYARDVRRLLSCPYVLAIHDGAFPELAGKTTGNGAGLDLGWVAGTICMSERIREVFSELEPRVPTVHLSPLLDDSLPALDEPLPAPLGELFRANDAVVCSSGALAAHYGLADVLEAHAALCSNGRRVGLLLLLGSFVRDASIAEKVRHAAVSFGSDRVQVLTDYPAGPAAIARSSVYVRPSRVESFGLALHEALLAGVPVVATHHPTRPPGVIAYEAGDVAGLAAAIERGLTPAAVAAARSLADEERIRVRENRDQTLDFLRACR